MELEEYQRLTWEPITVIRTGFEKIDLTEAETPSGYVIYREIHFPDQGYCLRRYHRRKAPYERFRVDGSPTEYKTVTTLLKHI